MRAVRCLPCADPDSLSAANRGEQLPADPGTALEVAMRTLAPEPALRLHCRKSRRQQESRREFGRMPWSVLQSPNVRRSLVSLRPNLNTAGEVPPAN